MTKEQWLENMLSDSPDYAELLKELENTKDRDLLNYLINGITSMSTSDKLWEFVPYTSFLYNALDSKVTDFMLDNQDLEFIETLKKNEDSK